jgi:hypothetical protein
MPFGPLRCLLKIIVSDHCPFLPFAPFNIKRIVCNTGAVEKPYIKSLRLLRFARNDTGTHFLSLRGAERRSNLDFFNSPTLANDIENSYYWLTAY